MKTLAQILLWFAITASMAPVLAQTPSCGDKRTTDLMLKVIKEQMIDVDQYKNLNISHYRKNVSFEKSVPTSYQKEILKFTCKTVLVVDTSKGFDKRMTDSFNTPTLGDRQTAVSFVLSAYWDRPKNRFAVPLTYTSQNADGQHYVEVETVKSMTASFIGSFVAAHAEPQSLPN